jgi:hypothetical protein
MKNKLFLFAILLFSVAALQAQTNQEFYNIEVKNIKGKDVKLQDYKNKVILVVNTASKCGLTPQYEGMENLTLQIHQLYTGYKGFPSLRIEVLIHIYLPY